MKFKTNHPEQQELLGWVLDLERILKCGENPGICSYPVLQSNPLVGPRIKHSKRHSAAAEIEIRTSCRAMLCPTVSSDHLRNASREPTQCI